MSERLSNYGYVALKPEATPGVLAGTPALYAPIYSEELMTAENFVENNPIIGVNWKRYQVLPGLRAHKGTLQVMAEPNTGAHWHNMLMVKGAPSGSGPYTHPMTFPTAATQSLPKSYSMDIGLGSQVVRFLGVAAGDIAPTFEENEMRFDVSVSALKAFAGVEIASKSGSGPYTLNLKTIHDPTPTEYLVVGDLIQIFDVSAGVWINAEVDSIVDGDTITVSEDMSAVVAGDWLTLRQATPSYAHLRPFLWSHTHFFFSDTAANALTASATLSNQTRMDEETIWKLLWPFKDEDGEKRSGSQDPAALVRLQADGEFTAKRFFDTPEDMRRFNAIEKRACVIRCYSGDSNEYEMRVTWNNLRLRTTPKPPLATEEVLYSTTEFAPTYDTSDSQAVDVKFINALATIV